MTGADLQWARRFWQPPASTRQVEAGARIEIGRPRDAVWDELLTRIESGLALAIDYGHVAGSRPPEGTLTAYRHGCQVAPVPDGKCDITAHVAVDSLTHDDLVRQRAALQDLGLTGHRPPDELAHSDPGAYLAALTRASHEAALIARGGFGDFWWVLARRPLPMTGSEVMTPDVTTADVMTPQGMTPEAMASEGTTPDVMTPQGMTPEAMASEATSCRS